MAEPTLSFLYNIGSDTAYEGTGGDDAGWKEMVTVTTSGSPDTIVFTGGGINPALSTPTATYGSREATLRPVFGTVVIPQTYVETQIGTIMRNVPVAGKNANKHAFAVYIDGAISSDLYLEAWDDSSFSTTASPVLAGTPYYPYSMLNAIRYSEDAGDDLDEHDSSWHGTTYSGTMRSANLKGYDNRVKLKGDDYTANAAVHYNMYVELPYDASLFHGTPVLTFRYLYT